MLVFGIMSFLPARAFSMLKFYILISKDPGRLWRHFSPHYSNLNNENTEVVINTLDKQDERDLVQFCHDFDIPYHITKSNGTPGKGKNSVLQIFSKSSHDYCVQIDGDDLLTPHGVELYQQIAESGSAPDAICLKNQVVMTPSRDLRERKSFPNYFFKARSEQLDYDQIHTHMLQHGLDPETADNYIKYKKKFHLNADKYVEGDETHCRTVFFSKKAAQYRFSENRMIGEDTLHYLELKNAHMTEELTVLCNNEGPATYVYYQHPESTVWTETNAMTDLEWINGFNLAVEKLEGKLWESDLPELEVDYKTPPNMNDYGYIGPLGYVKDNRVVFLPTNTERACVERLWQDHSTPMEK
jgi:glycosyltransferase involved in cell wall biosynthesis